MPSNSSRYAGLDYLTICHLEMDDKREREREGEKEGDGGSAHKVMKDGWSEVMYTKREIGITPPGIHGGWVALWGFPLASGVRSKRVTRNKNCVYQRHCCSKL